MEAYLTYVTVSSFTNFQTRAITVSAILNSVLHVHDISQIPGFLPLRLECTDIKIVTVIHIPEPHPWAGPRYYPGSCYTHQLKSCAFSLTSEIVYKILIRNDSLLSYSIITSTVR